MTTLPTIMPVAAFTTDERIAWLVPHVESWHEQSQAPRHDPGWFHASSLGQSDDALRAQYRGIAGDTHRAGTLRIFDNGHGRDAAWKRYLRDSGLSVARNRADKVIRIERLKLTGECDDIIRRPNSTDAPVVLEFKTINPFAFNNLHAPKADHVLQVHAYMAGLELDEAIVLYENKANQELRPFLVPFDITIWIALYARLRRLLRELTKDTKSRVSAEGRRKAWALE